MITKRHLDRFPPPEAARALAPLPLDLADRADKVCGAAAFWVDRIAARRWYDGAIHDRAIMLTEGNALFVCSLAGGAVAFSELLRVLPVEPTAVIWRATIRQVLFRGALNRREPLDAIAERRCYTDPVETPRLWERLQKARGWRR